MTARSLPLDEARAGMTLAEDVCDCRHALLLPKGTRLTESHLAALSLRKIPRVAITPPPLGEAEIEAARQRLDHLFRRVGDDDLSRALQRTVLDYRREQGK